MIRSRRGTFLIIAILWQALVWLTPWGQEQRVNDLANTLTHAQALSHHHHDDHSLHMDGHVAEASQHQHSNEAVQHMGLMPSINGFSTDQSRSTKFPNITAVIAAVFHLGLLRPPQHTAV
ncbi:MAG: hypothetical protein EXR25_13215 [Limnohabitans sp.]|nr:hypothetical protein [Limnohabitans sp.]